MSLLCIHRGLQDRCCGGRAPGSTCSGHSRLPLPKGGPQSMDCSANCRRVTADRHKDSEIKQTQIWGESRIMWFTVQWGDISESQHSLWEVLEQNGLQADNDLLTSLKSCSRGWWEGQVGVLEWGDSSVLSEGLWGAEEGRESSERWSPVWKVGYSPPRTSQHSPYNLKLVQLDIDYVEK